MMNNKFYHWRYFKFLKILGFFLFTSLTICCSGDDFGNPQRQFDYGTITALKNGEPWTAVIHGADGNGQHDYFGIDIRVYNQQDYEREGLSFSRLPKSQSIGNIINLCGNGCLELYQSLYVTLAADGDVFCDVYNVVEELGDENVLEITEYNLDSKEFRGKFSVTFAIDEDRTRCNPNAPDTIRFTNGQFHSKITR